ncbi:MAG: hypothetical protein R2865_09015 [Deinococcales bacterium]
MLSSLPVALVVVHRPLQEHEKLLAEFRCEIILEGLTQQRSEPFGQ